MCSVLIYGHLYSTKVGQDDRTVKLKRNTNMNETNFKIKKGSAHARAHTYRVIIIAIYRATVT